MLRRAACRGERGGHGGRIEIHQPVPAGGDRLDPFGRVAEGDARHAVQVRLLLHAARVGQAGGRRHEQRREVEVAQRRGEASGGARPFQQAGPLERRPRARVHGEDDRHLDGLDHLHERPDRLGQGVRRPVRGEDDVPAGLDPGLCERVRPPGCDRREYARDVDHDVADHVDAGGDALGGEVRDGRVGRAEAQVGEDVDHHPVQLLRHAPVERAQARLDVADRHVLLRGDEGARQGRVRVTVDEHGVRGLVSEHRLETDEHARGLLGVGARAALDTAVGRAQPELLEEDLREVGVVVLAGVHEDVVAAAVERPGDWRSLDELRAVAHDGDDLHCGQPTGRARR